MEEKDYKELLRKFSTIPKYEYETTYLELCHYSGERFEEICSRILEFYLNPRNKHGFGTLWFDALCKLLKISCDDPYEMSSWTEESTSTSWENNKRIDIVLSTPSTLIAIENKIGADLYNPLDVYKKHIENKFENIKQKKLLVLTGHLLRGEEIKKAEESGFIVLLYHSLFAEVKQMLGNYISKCDQKYLVYMLDFIKTVENRINIMEQNQPMDSFISKNKCEIEELIKQYNEWKNRVKDNQKMSIAKLQNILNNELNINWGCYEGWLLSIDFNRETARIGIEADYKEDGGDPTAEFHIYITTWKMNCWIPEYGKSILEKYPIEQGCYLDMGENNSNNRVYYHLPVIRRNDYKIDGEYIDEIISKLKDCYDFMKELTERVDKNNV